MGDYKVQITAIKSGKEGAYAFCAILLALLLEEQVRRYVPGFEGDEQNKTTVVILTTGLIALAKAARNFLKEMFRPSATN